MRRVRALLVAAIVVGGVAATTAVASAETALRGLITGRVMECAPGPVVASPPAPTPEPTPDVVTLYRDGILTERELVTMPTKLPWTGTFSFSVAPARYEIVSSYQHRVRWANVTAGSRTIVDFNTMACPL